jgi:hypothetical protein
LLWEARGLQFVERRWIPALSLLLDGGCPAIRGDGIQRECLAHFVGVALGVYLLPNRPLESVDLLQRQLAVAQRVGDLLVSLRLQPVQKQAQSQLDIERRDAEVVVRTLLKNLLEQANRKVHRALLQLRMTRQDRRRR